MALPKAGTRCKFEDVHPDDTHLRRPRVIERDGIIWSLADTAMSVWVIPDDDPRRGAVKVRWPGQGQKDKGVMPFRVDGPVKVPGQLDRAR
jgi:hypothetical protein